MVFCRVCGCCCWFGGAGCGTSAFKPFGVNGVITMKMMIRTKRISIRGTTFIVAIEPPCFPPTSIPIVVAPYFKFRVAVQSPGRMSEQVMTGKRGQTPRFPAQGLASWRWRGCSLLFSPVGNEPNVIDARGANFVHDLHHIAVLGTAIALPEHGLIEPVRKAVANLIGNLRNVRLRAD